MKVLYASSEVVPFAKTGGLADVAGALPVYLKNAGCDIRVITPLYRITLEQRLDLDPIGGDFELRIGPVLYYGKFFRSAMKRDTPVYFIHCDELYDRPGLYGDGRDDYPDNAQRFIFFCRAALELCRRIGFAPDIVHGNDWQCGLLPAYIKSGIGPGFFDKTVCVFTIHNIAYQGLFDWSAFDLTGLPHWFFDMSGLEFWGKMNMIKAGIVFSRMITTVSCKYAQEIQTPEFGGGLEGILQHRRDDLRGILNGVDYDEWDPATDRHIASRYSPDTMQGKQQCKRDLLKRLHLPAGLLKVPLIGSVSRLVDQKGFDLIAPVMESILDLGAAYVLLGTGDRAHERVFQELSARNKKRMAVRLAYDNELAHKIEAGCDMFLMPSRYEPCGLNQIYSLKYGTVPIVRATGGLDDTIIGVDGAGCGNATGFKFSDCSSEALLAEVERAVTLYNSDASGWSRIVSNGMASDFSWDRSSSEYLRLYADARQTP